MGRKKKTDQIRLPSVEVEQLKKDYVDELEKNPQYSLFVDPKNQYDLSEDHKKFILNYVQYKNIMTAAEMTGIDADVARDYFRRFETQQEIRRLNVALYYRQFSAKMLNLDSIGGYLSSLLVDHNIPYADQLKSNEKLKVVELLLKVNDMQQQSFTDPSIIDSRDLASEIKDLSVSSIKRLLTESNNKEKEKLISQIGGKEGLTIEETTYLNSLSIHELLEIIEKNKRGEK